LEIYHKLKLYSIFHLTPQLFTLVYSQNQMGVSAY